MLIESLRLLYRTVSLTLQAYYMIILGLASLKLSKNALSIDYNNLQLLPDDILCTQAGWANFGTRSPYISCIDSLKAMFPYRLPLVTFTFLMAVP